MVNRFYPCIQPGHEKNYTIIMSEFVYFSADDEYWTVDYIRDGKFSDICKYQRKKRRKSIQI
jgi:hypothetical protein